MSCYEALAGAYDALTEDVGYAQRADFLEKLLRRSAELHRQRAYSAEELTAWLTEAGFGDIRVYGDGKLRRPKEDEQRIYFSCVRK